MKRPTLVELAQVAEVIAAVAVVVSLVYVGKELRSNTAAVRGASLQAIMSAGSEALLGVASDSAFSRIRQIGDRDPSELSEAEAYRYRLILRQYWLAMQNVYIQSELELIDPRIWAGYAANICGAWSNPGARVTWPQHRPVLDAGFAEWVESCAP
jgi:hypothetical protein